MVVACSGDLETVALRRLEKTSKKRFYEGLQSGTRWMTSRQRLQGIGALR